MNRPNSRSNEKLTWVMRIVLTAMLVSAASAQQLPSYLERPPDAAGIFARRPGSGVPPGSEKWVWHEQQMRMPGMTESARMVRRIVIPTVTMFRTVAETVNGTALTTGSSPSFRRPV
jgi:hypothetical protein